MHGDVTVINPLFQLIVSFRWRPLIDTNFKKDIEQWLKEPEPLATLEIDANYPPNLIIIGLHKSKFKFSLIKTIIILII